MNNKISGYDLPDSVTITFSSLGYYEKSALARNWHGDPSAFDASAAYKNMVTNYQMMEASTKTMKPAYDKTIAASILIDFVVRNWNKSSCILSDWATGDTDEFDSWIGDFECSREFVTQFIELNGDTDEHNNCTPGGGPYGFDAYRYGAIVVAMDTEGQAFYFPSGIEIGPNVENFEEIETESSH